MTYEHLHRTTTGKFWTMCLALLQKWVANTEQKNIRNRCHIFFGFGEVWTLCCIHSPLIPYYTVLCTKDWIRGIVESLDETKLNETDCTRAWRYQLTGMVLDNSSEFNAAQTSVFFSAVVRSLVLVLEMTDTSTFSDGRARYYLEAKASHFHDPLLSRPHQWLSLHIANKISVSSAKLERGNSDIFIAASNL